MNPFDYLNSINATKKNIMVDEDTEKGYNPFMTNRGLSYFEDTVLFANEMNRASHLDNRLQYDFLRQGIRQRKRFSKWMKKETDDKIEVIKEYYGYSNDKAYAVIDLISDEMFDRMKKTISKGGKAK